MPFKKNPEFIDRKGFAAGLVIGLLVFFLFVIFLTPFNNKKISWLSTKGNIIVDQKGQKVILRGVNIPGLDWDEQTSQWNLKAVNYAISKWKANVIRTRINQDNYFSDKQKTLNDLEKQIISPARKKGVYVIIHPVIHDENSLPDENTLIMWREIAQRYKDDPAIIYDFLAEPHDVEKQELYDAYVQLIDEIRSINPNSLIMVTGLVWGREINSYLEKPFPYPNIIYRTNPYNKNGEFYSLFGEIAKHFPVFIGEFGPDSNPPMTKDDVVSLLKYADKLQIGWTAWNFHSTGCPCLLSDFKTFTPSEYGKIVKETLTKQAEIPDSVSSEDLHMENDNLHYYIYSDTLQNGYLDYSWNTLVSLQDDTKVHSGKYVIKAKYQNKSASVVLYSVNTVWSGDYKTLSFFLNWGGQKPFAIDLGMDDKNGTTIFRDGLSKYLTGEPNGWQRAEIPLSGIAGFNIGRVFLENKSVEIKLPLYIDDIMYISNN